MTDRWNRTVLHRASMRGDHNIVKYILSLLSESQHFQIVTMKAFDGDTLLHCAAQQQSDNHELIESVLTSLSESECVNLVSMQNRGGDTALHWAANRGTPSLSSAFWDYCQKNRACKLYVYETGMATLHCMMLLQVSAAKQQ